MATKLGGIAAVAIGTVALALVGIQLLPFGVPPNAPVVQEPAWDSPATRALARRACFDCHSNETAVPWYGHIAPFSWLVGHHVEEGREMLNFSDIARSEEADDAAEVVTEGEMPPAYYTFLHPSARLTSAERDQLARGLAATLGSEDDEGGEGGEAGEADEGRGRGRGHDDDGDDD